MSHRKVRTDARRDAILRLLRMGHGLASAASSVGIGRQTLREWRLDDPAFGSECEMAAEHCADIAEHELFRRGVKGGDTLALIAWLRANRREKYHRRMLVEVEGGERPVGIEHTLAPRGDDARVRFYMPSNSRDGPPSDDEAGPVIEGIAQETPVEDAASEEAA